MFYENFQNIVYLEYSTIPGANNSNCLVRVRFGLLIDEFSQVNFFLALSWCLVFFGNFEYKFSLRTFVALDSGLFLRKNPFFTDFRLTSMSVFACQLPEELEFEVSDRSFTLWVIAFNGHFYLLAWVKLILLNKNFGRWLLTQQAHNTADVGL